MKKTLKHYLSSQKIRILLSILATILAYGALSTSRAIRFDTDVFMYDPQSFAASWKELGRFGLVLLKKLLFLQSYHPVRSGITFMVCILLAAFTIGLYLFRFCKEEKSYPYWIFFLLFGTSQIWAFQIYFILQEGEIGFMCWLTALTAGMLIKTYFENESMQSQILKSILGSVLLFWGIATYQAFVYFYVTICICFFLCIVYHADANQKYVPGILKLIGTFFVSLLAYFVTQKLFFSQREAYLAEQIRWGKVPFSENLAEIKYVISQTLKLRSASEFSIYPLTLLLFIGVVFVIIKCQKQMSASQKLWFLIALCACMLTPFMANLIMGGLVVKRMQFCMQLAAAFLPFLGAVVLQPYWKKIEHLLLSVICVVCVIAQISINYALYLDDEKRNAEDAYLAHVVADELKDMNYSDKPVIFLGIHRHDNVSEFLKCSDYGYSFFEWGNTVTPPDASTPAAIRAMRAYEELSLVGTYSPYILAEAVATGLRMPVLPEKGSVYDAGEFIVVKLSEYQ